MSQDVHNEKKFFDDLAEEKFQYSALKKKCFEKLFIELSKFIIDKERIAKYIMELKIKKKENCWYRLPRKKYNSTSFLWNQ